MVDIAQEALNSQNFSLATEIYERVIKEKGPASELFVQLGNCLALSGRISEAFIAFSKAYRLGAVKSEELGRLVQSLVKLTRERMEAVVQNQTSTVSHENTMARFLYDAKLLFESEPFFCGLCLGTVMEPTTIYCGHTYCKRCLDKSDHDNCIVCGRNPHVTELRINVLISNVEKRLFPQLEELWRLKLRANEQFNNGAFLDAIQLYTEILAISK